MRLIEGNVLDPQVIPTSDDSDLFYGNALGYQVG